MSALREAFLPFFIARELHEVLKYCLDLTTLHLTPSLHYVPPFDGVYSEGIRVVTLINFGALELNYIRDILRACPSMEVLSLYRTDLTRLPGDWRERILRDPVLGDYPPEWLDRIEIDLQTDEQGEWGDRPVLRFYDPVCGLRPSDLNSIGFRAVPSFELAISQAIYHSKWLLGRFLGLMKGIAGQATETAA
jgi:hypothetical protein